MINDNEPKTYKFKMKIDRNEMIALAELLAYKVEETYKKNSENNFEDFKEDAQDLLLATLVTYEKFDFSLHQPQEEQPIEFQPLYTDEENIALMGQFVGNAAMAYYKTTYLPEHPDCTTESFFNMFSNDQNLQNKIWQAVSFAAFQMEFPHAVHFPTEQDFDENEDYEDDEN